MPETRRLIAKQGDKLDLMLWRELGLGPRHIAPVLKANPGLADLGPILPIGTIVIVPATTTKRQNSTRTRPLIQLWD